MQEVSDKLKDIHSLRVDFNIIIIIGKQFMIRYFSKQSFQAFIISKANITLIIQPYLIYLNFE